MTYTAFQLKQYAFTTLIHQLTYHTNEFGMNWCTISVKNSLLSIPN